MRVYLIKRKNGAVNWSNILLERELTFADGDVIHTGLLFIRKKDAKKYLNSLEYSEYYEVISATINK